MLRRILHHLIRPLSDSPLPEAEAAAIPSQAGASANVLVVTHTAQGEILSLHWPQSSDCQNCEDLVGHSVTALFGPVAAPALPGSRAEGISHSGTRRVQMRCALW